jgi:hypothetical protein
MQLLDDLKEVPEIERSTTRLQSVENSLQKRLQTCNMHKYKPVAQAGKWTVPCIKFKLNYPASVSFLTLKELYN